MTEKKKTDEWIETAERFGNQLAQHLERFGDKLQKAVESIETSISSSGSTIEVEDHRSEKTGEPIEKLGRGEVFDHQKALYMRVSGVPGDSSANEVYAVNLASGDVRPFERGTRVEPVEAKVVVRERPGKGA